MKTAVSISAALLCISFCLCCTPAGTDWTRDELTLIGDDSSAPMRVLTVAEWEDSLFLRRTDCGTFTREDILSEQYATLAVRMVVTVTSPEQDGVGIAGPQVGISRRIVAVQRFDKEGEPFEVYPNIEITAVRGEPEDGGEGCLSVPDRKGVVPRYRDIDIRYTSPVTLADTVENVKGFSAVIFQHECDHLRGVLYTDYLN